MNITRNLLMIRILTTMPNISPAQNLAQVVYAQIASFIDTIIRKIVHKILPRLHHILI